MTISALAWFSDGGPVMVALLILGITLYSVLFHRLSLLLVPSTRLPADGSLVRTMIAAAPLLGLLGTVGGLITSFDALLSDASVRTVGVGIGHALRTTQYGMALAAPALFLEQFILSPRRSS